jgi:hypothetical protein
MCRHAGIVLEFRNALGGIAGRIFLPLVRWFERTSSFGCELPMSNRSSGW